MFKRALVSTSHKDGLVNFIKPIAESGCQIVSTGGTSKFLKDNGISVTEVAEVTGFPEMMDGRVRTLHPKIHMGLLARSSVAEDFQLLKEYGVEPFDLVVVNLYPFAEAAAKGLRGHDLIEQIDIGGPTLLRAAAKSFERITVVCEPSDYAEVQSRAKNKTITEDFRLRLATKVFAHCSQYDLVVSQTLAKENGASIETTDDELPEQIHLNLTKKQSLRYGENPQQKAAFYAGGPPHPLSLLHGEQLQGKELSYNNILDLEAAVSVVSEFDSPASVIIKHNNPCGVGLGDSIFMAYEKSFNADSVSAFGGIVAFNGTIDKKLAEAMINPFFECIIAPEFTPEAIQVFQNKKNLRLLVLENLKKPQFVSQLELKSLRGAFLAQTSDLPMKWSSEWKIIGKNPPEGIRQDLVFAQRVVKHVKSNGIVIACDGQTIGICGGQTNRVDSVKMALERAQKKGKIEKWVLASDAFFPFRDSVDLAAQGGIKWIIQPGGSMRDQEVEEAVEQKGLSMVLTGRRHFKH